jgi:hypothetical protein
MIINLNKYETYQEYMKREGCSKQLLNNRIVNGKVKIKYFPELKLKLIIK